jgi:glucans biosynthesis protein
MHSIPTVSKMTRHRILIAFLALLPGSQALAFGFEDIVARAQQQAAAAYQPPRDTPDFLRGVGYDQYRGMRFQIKHNLWADTGSRFQVTPVMPGGVYAHIIPINVVSGDGIEPLAFHKEYFRYDDPTLAQQLPDDLGYAGFELSYPMAHRSVQQKFLVFAGASYFRVVNKGGQWGLSARGAAIDTGLPKAEEFPDFVEFWLVQPARDASRMTIYALLDSPRLCGAYEFVITPGPVTDLDVRSVLFTRERIELLGIAPLTSMYFYGENMPRPPGAWRPEVHDSDGLQIDDDGTRIWRPLLAPRGVRLENYPERSVRAFGLLQRDTQFASYQDQGARYDLRPSALVQTLSGFDDGRVVLVLLPTINEYNDNVVAFWAPSKPVEAHERLETRYRMRFSDPSVARGELGEVRHTFVGRDFVGADKKGDSRRFVIDFRGGPLDRLSQTAVIAAKVEPAQGTEVIEHQLERIEPTGDWRLSILARPAAAQPLALRATLDALNGAPLSETWSYELEHDAD